MLCWSYASQDKFRIRFAELHVEVEEGRSAAAPRARPTLSRSAADRPLPGVLLTRPARSRHAKK
jgi:hypothetical protein